MAIDGPAETTLSDRELVLQFESLGDNCELGLVQRRVGVEPLGMFRFAGAPLRHLIRAMSARFEGMADPANIRIEPQRDEYMVRLTKYDFLYHADVRIGEADLLALHQQQTRIVGFLVDKLIADLEQAEKIVVFRQNEDLSANDLLDFRTALAAYGPVTLLWVQATRPGHPAGTVERVDDRLLIGYVTRLASRGNAPDLDLRSWLVVLRQAHGMRLDRPAVRGPVAPTVEPPARIDIVFGRDGNAGGYLGYGWSGVEDGFIWSIDDRSALTIARLKDAESYYMEMDMVPYVAPPAVPAQTMDVVVNGRWVYRFDPVPRGKAGCTVPGHLLRGRDPIEIVLNHPAAASPKAASGQNDDRRLAVAFYRLSLIGG